MFVQIRILATQPEASRYILSFHAEPVEIEGQPWVKLLVVGQSFMMHQIRYGNARCFLVVVWRRGWVGGKDGIDTWERTGAVLACV